MPFWALACFYPKDMCLLFDVFGKMCTLYVSSTWRTIPQLYKVHDTCSAALMAMVYRQTGFNPRIEKKIISICDLFKIFDVYFL